MTTRRRTPEPGVARGRQREIEADCQRVVLSVFRDLDAFDYARLIEHFTLDGLWEREGRELVGHEQILAGLEQRPRNQVVRHQITNLIIEAHAPSQARASGYNTAYRALGASPHDLPVAIKAPLGLWVLEASLVLCGDVWLIGGLRQARQFSFTQ